jgi:hypothetical protein
MTSMLTRTHYSMLQNTTGTTLLKETFFLIRSIFINSVTVFIYKLLYRLNYFSERLRQLITLRH